MKNQTGTKTKKFIAKCPTCGHKTIPTTVTKGKNYVYTTQTLPIPGGNFMNFQFLKPPTKSKKRKE